jgi:hypothetical protein
MKETKKASEIEPTEEESYLTYTIHKLVIIVKDNATVNIDNLMSGKPKDPPPPGNP